MSKENVMRSIARQPGVIVDLGCGFKGEVGQRSVHNDYAIGIDLNFQHGHAMTYNPVISDVQVLPIRDRVVSFMNASAILEHLPHADEAMREMSRVMKSHSKGFILIPVDSRQIPQTLKRFLTEFPFSLGRVLKTLINATTFWHLPGVPHITQISLEDIARHFRITYVWKKRFVHAWFQHGPLRILQKLGFAPALIDTYNEWYIWIKSKEAPQ